MSDKKAEVVEGNSKPQLKESKNWIFTWNNPEVEKIEWKEFMNNLVYCKYQLEQAPTTGTKHFQGWLQLARKKDIIYMKKHFSNRAHWTNMRGTPNENEVYCSKGETKLDGPWVIGDFKNVTNQGERTDLKEMLEAWIECKSVSTMLLNYGDKWIQWQAKIKPIAAEVTCERSSKKNRDIEVIYIYGKPGSGKSHMARELCPNCYPMSSDLKWWGFYSGEEEVVFDDINDLGKEGVERDRWLTILDKYPKLVDVKNGHVWLNFTKAVITSNEHPKVIWDNEKWIRRFSKIIYCWKEGEVFKWKEEKKEEKKEVEV